MFVDSFREEMSCANASTHFVVSISWEYPPFKLSMGFIYFDDDEEEEDD